MEETRRQGWPRLRCRPSFSWKSLAYRISLLGHNLIGFFRWCKQLLQLLPQLKVCRPAARYIKGPTYHLHQYPHWLLKSKSWGVGFVCLLLLYLPSRFRLLQLWRIIELYSNGTSSTDLDGPFLKVHPMIWMALGHPLTLFRALWTKTQCIVPPQNSILTLWLVYIYWMAYLNTSPPTATWRSSRIFGTWFVQLWPCQVLRARFSGLRPHKRCYSPDSVFCTTRNRARRSNLPYVGPKCRQTLWI